MPIQRGAMIAAAIVAALSLIAGRGWAKGQKGQLEANELDWIETRFIPILLESKLCTNATGDCRHDWIVCISGDGLSCDVYGVSDPKVVKKIVRSILDDDLDVSSFRIWKSRYHETRSLERPLVEFSNRMTPK